MIHPLKKAEQADRPPETTTLPPTLEADYIEGVVKPFFLSSPGLLPVGTHTVVQNNIGFKGTEWKP
jgi:hypothetical protein